MPIYEFYCSGCHTLLNFFSATVDTEKRPRCPHCGAPGLERRPARFATLKGGADEETGSPLDGVDERRMERAMAAMADELEAAGEGDDPRQMGRLMRRFGELSGLELGPEMESFVARLEAGEDPDAIEAEIEALDDPDDASLDAWFRLGKRSPRSRSRPPRRDDELYFL